MTDRRFNRLLGAVVVLVVLAAAVGIYQLVNDDIRQGECVANKPQDIWGGSIRTEGGGLFSAGVEAYYLRERGTWEGTGKACRTWWRVTQRKYEEEMYGECNGEAE